VADRKDDSIPSTTTTSITTTTASDAGKLRPPVAPLHRNNAYPLCTTFTVNDTDGSTDPTPGK
ncbi:hypothetical protein RYX36_000237, partial [Vicia faba]